MANMSGVTSRRAPQGEKMIEVKLRFWTNNIAGAKGEIVPRHAWSGGVVRMEPNKSHGIAPKSPQVFHSLLDVGAVIEKVLIAHGIVLHSSRKMRKYMSTGTAECGTRDDESR
jgi:hypothetical protein